MALEKFNMSRERGKIGEGDFATVYQSPDANKVIKVMKSPTEYGFDQLSANETKSAYYLYKIALILFPRNIPDIHCTGLDNSGEAIAIVDKVEHDERHKSISAIHSKIKAGSKLLPKEQKLITRIHGIGNLPLEDKFIRAANNAGIIIDNGLQNFTVSPQGYTVYVDTDVAYRTRHGMPIRLKFSPPELSKAITNIKDKQQRTRAKNLYDRLIEIVKLCETERIEKNMKTVNGERV